MRVFDIIFSVFLMVLLSPLCLITAMLVLCCLGRPIFFVQPRVGKNNKVFNLYKFRTMRVASVNDPASDAVRLTRVGKKLRQWSLDELPQLWNVLRNDMSFVGPRPLLVEYLEKYNAHQRRRHEVKPGITGWAQVNGRNTLSWEEKFNYDVWYVDHRSFWLNMKILCMTVCVVFGGKGTQHAGEATAPVFRGEKAIKEAQTILAQYNPRKKHLSEEMIKDRHDEV